MHVSKSIPTRKMNSNNLPLPIPFLNDIINTKTPPNKMEKLGDTDCDAAADG